MGDPNFSRRNADRSCLSVENERRVASCPRRKPLIKCRINVGPPYTTLAQQWPCIGSMACVFWGPSRVRTLVTDLTQIAGSTSAEKPSTPAHRWPYATKCWATVTDGGPTFSSVRPGHIWVSFFCFHARWQLAVSRPQKHSTSCLKSTQVIKKTRRENDTFAFSLSNHGGTVFGGVSVKKIFWKVWICRHITFKDVTSC